ncbi:MAG: rod shape-determining protein RodA [Candidatus Susulua stagnicola]|nr:rod shape-determining protein RodA [Candidatus Susulua stagnicola]
MFNLKILTSKVSGLKTIVICLIFLNLLSLFSIYSSLHQGGELANHIILFKQLIWIVASWVLLILFSSINYRIYFDAGYVIYVLNLLLLLSTYLFGKTAMGAQRWISIFGITFQPSEISKIAIIIILARFFSQNEYREPLKNFIIPFCLVTLNALVIFKQPDLGTALIIVFIFFGLGFFSKVKKRYFIFLIVLGLILSPFALKKLEDYQIRRLTVFINPNVDPLGSGYTIIQSKIAIGSGGLTGQGFLAGTQNQFNFLPERHTDFIFTVIAEEWGFIGVFFLLLVYWLILKKILQQAKGLRDPFAYYLCLGISLVFFLHIFINVGMTLGILPVVGLPLICLSYGGTSLVINFILLGMFFNIARR